MAESVALVHGQYHVGGADHGLRNLPGDVSHRPSVRFASSTDPAIGSIGLPTRAASPADSTSVSCRLQPMAEHQFGGGAAADVADTHDKDAIDHRPSLTSRGSLRQRQPLRGTGRAQRKSPPTAGFRGVIGAGNRNRTYDLRITNAPLYQLSYSGVDANCRESRRVETSGQAPSTSRAQSTSCTRSSRGSANTMSSGLPSSSRTSLGAQFAQAVDDAAHQHVGRGCAGGDADMAAALHPARVDLARRRRSGGPRRLRARPVRAGGWSWSCWAIRPPARGRIRCASSRTASWRFCVA